MTEPVKIPRSCVYCKHNSRCRIYHARDVTYANDVVLYILNVRRVDNKYTEVRRDFYSYRAISGVEEND